MLTNFKRSYSESILTKSQYCSTAKIQIDSLTRSPINNGGNFSLSFLVAKTLVSETPALSDKTIPVATAIIAAYAAKATPTDAAIFYTIA